MCNVTWGALANPCTTIDPVASDVMVILGASLMRVLASTRITSSSRPWQRTSTSSCAVDRRRGSHRSSTSSRPRSSTHPSMCPCSVRGAVAGRGDGVTWLSHLLGCRAVRPVAALVVVTMMATRPGMRS